MFQDMQGISISSSHLFGKFVKINDHNSASSWHCLSNQSVPSYLCLYTDNVCDHPSSLSPSKS